jgi:hypothetical protein
VTHARLQELQQAKDEAKREAARAERMQAELEIIRTAAGASIKRHK